MKREDPTDFHLVERFRSSYFDSLLPSLDCHESDVQVPHMALLRDDLQRLA